MKNELKPGALVSARNGERYKIISVTISGESAQARNLKNGEVTCLSYLELDS